GVRVRVLLPSSATPIDGAALARSGVRIRLVAKPYIHAKAVLTDRSEAFIGSENLSGQSLDRNREIGVLLRGPVVDRLRLTFQSDWKRGR
ncbi:MAG: phospholipase D-like domain-containing protein, partial [Chloroflexota bacterium]